MNAPLISAENLGIVRQNRVLFRGLNFSLTAGEGVHLLGENGSGKTTFMQLLAGTLPIPFGQVTRHAPLIYLGHRAGVKGLLTVRENLLLFAKLYHGMGKLPRAALEERITSAITAMGLIDYCDALLNQLSAGQQRRVQLARLWLDTPPIWLLDEPLNALDTQTVARLGEKCCAHLGNQGALLITSHQTLPFGSTQIARRELSSLY